MEGTAEELKDRCQKLYKGVKKFMYVSKYLSFSFVTTVLISLSGLFCVYKDSKNTICGIIFHEIEVKSIGTILSLLVLN